MSYYSNFLAALHMDSDIRKHSRIGLAVIYLLVCLSLTDVQYPPAEQFDLHTAVDFPTAYHCYTKTHNHILHLTVTYSFNNSFVL